MTPNQLQRAEIKVLIREASYHAAKMAQKNPDRAEEYLRMAQDFLQDIKNLE